MNDQLELTFNPSGEPGRSDAGYRAFAAGREGALQQLEERFGVIVNKRVRVTLAGFPGEFTGKLVLDQLIPPQDRKEELRLRIGPASFDYREMESCVVME